MEQKVTEIFQEVGSFLITWDHSLCNSGGVTWYLSCAAILGRVVGQSKQAWARAFCHYSEFSLSDQIEGLEKTGAIVKDRASENRSHSILRNEN